MTAIRIVHNPQQQPGPQEPVGVDMWALVPTLGLVALGVAMVFSASFPLAAARESEDVFYYLKRQVGFVVVGIPAMWWASRLSLSALRRRAGLLAIATVLLLGAVLVFGREVSGARRWFAMPGVGLNFQPSELAKLTLVIAAARWLARFPRGVPTWRAAVPPLALLGLVAGLIAVQPDLGTASVIAAAALVFYHIGGLKLRHIAAAGGAGLSLAAVVVWRHPYQLQRILDFLAGDKVALEGGYQRARSLIALGSGGVTGRGYGGSIDKYFYLPAATTDSILVVVGEELGLVATWAVVLAFSLLVVRGMMIAGRARDRFSGLVAAGVTCVLGVQALVHIAVATGSVPATGLPLPFVSYGGSSLICSLIGVGLILNVSRGARRVRAPT